MSTTINLTTSPQSVPLLTGNQLMIVEHTGGNMVYYRSTSNVGPGTNDGVLTLGQVTQFYSGPVWFASDSTAQIIVTYIPSPITPETVATITAPSSTILPLIYAPAPSGADDTAALQALVAAGRTVQLQRGVYNISSTLNCDNVVNLVLQGASGEWYSNSGTVIQYSGTGTAVSMRGTGGSTDGCVIRNLAIVANSATITVDFGTTSGTATDAGSSNCKLEKVYLRSLSSTTTILWNLAQAISCHADDCSFVGGGVGIQGVATASGFSNDHVIECSLFTGQTTIPIKNPFLNWVIQGNTFEPLASGAAGAITHDGTISNGVAGSIGLLYTGNSHQDSVTSAGSVWLTVRGEGISVIGNIFVSHADNHIKAPAGGNGLTIIGNTFWNDDVTPVALVGTWNSFTMLGNFWNSANLLSGTPGTPGIWQTNSATMHLTTHLAMTGGVGFYGATVVTQQNAVGTATGYAAGTTAATFHSDDTYTGNLGSTAYTINGIVHALKTYGLLAQ